jgi:hypothetical protein
MKAVATWWDASNTHENEPSSCLISPPWRNSKNADAQKEACSLQQIL